MTLEQLESLEIVPIEFAQLRDGGHLQIYGNEQHGICEVHVKPSRTAKWRSYFAVTAGGKGAYGGEVKELTLEELIEAVKDMPYVSSDVIEDVKEDR